MSSADVPMEVASIRMEEDGSQVRVTFELANTQSSKLYDFVKLFIGDEYIGLKYLDIPAGETRPVEFRFDPTAITGAPDMILTAGDRDDGVLFREPLREVSDKDLLQTDAIREQAKKLAETEISDETWERLEDEYIDLVQDEASRKRHVMERLREEYKQLREQKQQAEATGEPFEEEREQGEDEPEEPETVDSEAQRDTGDQAIEHEEQEGEKTDQRVGPTGLDDTEEQSIRQEASEHEDREAEEPSGPEDGDEDIQVQTLDEDGWDEEEKDTEEAEPPEEPARPFEDRDKNGKPDDGEDEAPKEQPQPIEDKDDEEEQEDEEESVLDAEPEGPKEPVESPEKHGEVGEKIQEHEKEEKEPEPESNLLQSVVGSVFGSESVDETEEQEDKEDEQSEEDDGDENEERSYGPDESELNDIPKIDADVKPSEQVKRRSTGIEGLDSKMQGGLVDGTMNLVTGKTGTGKTAFCANFLRRGAELDEPGVYVTTEEREEDIMADIESMFGWDFRKLEDQNKVKILSIKPIFPSKEIDNLNRLVRSYISNLLDEVMQAVEDIEAERVIIDSVSIIEMFIRDEYMARVALASLLNKLREAEVTAVLTGTVPETSEGLSGGGIIEFLVDTVLLMEFVPVAEEYSRTLTIRKMRRTDHEVEIFPIEITPNGMKLVEV